MKKLLLPLFLLMISFSSYADSYLDFSLSDFCYQQPNVQTRNGVFYCLQEIESNTTILIYVCEKISLVTQKKLHLHTAIQQQVT